MPSFEKSSNKENLQVREFLLAAADRVQLLDYEAQSILHEGGGVKAYEQKMNELAYYIANLPRWIIDLKKLGVKVSKEVEDLVADLAADTREAAVNKDPYKTGHILVHTGSKFKLANYLRQLAELSNS